LEDDHQQARISLAEQEVQVKSQHEKTNTLKKQLRELEKQLEAYQADLNKLVSIENMKENEPEINQMIETKKHEKENTTQQLRQLRSERADRTKRMRDQERELKEEQKAHQKL